MIVSVKELELKNKKVLLRVDFNVPFDEKGIIEDDFRIRKSLKTIKYLIQEKAKVILISHRGKPNGREEKYTLKPIKKRLEELLKKDVKFISDCLGKKVEEEISKMSGGDIILLENLRFYKGEEENNQEFAKFLAELGDFYVNDAFSVCHRSHASIVSLPKYLPSATGLLLENEIKSLERIKENPNRPLVAIIGGAKISSKIKFIEYFLREANSLLVGGKVANIILKARGDYQGGDWTKEKSIEEIGDINLSSENLYLPIDAVVSSNDKREGEIKELPLSKIKKGEFIFDIGPETIKNFSKIINSAKTIIWAGPLGFFENKLFEKGTKSIAKAIVGNKSAFKVVGGGDTSFAVSKLGFSNGFDHISTGGGAMLAFFGEKELPGIKALEK